MNRPVVQPPTNTTSGSSGPSRLATPLRSSMFRFGMSGPVQPNPEFLCGCFAFPGFSVADGIDQCQHFIQERIAQRGLGNGLVKGGKRISPGLPGRVGPNGRGIAARRDSASKRLRGVRSRHASRQSTALSREDVLQAMDEKLLECSLVRHFAKLRTMEKVSLPGPSDRGMD